MSDIQRDVARWERLCERWDRWVTAAEAYPSLLDVVNLHRRLQPRLRAVTARLGRVLTVGLLGGTGVGKSTLLNAIIGREFCLAGDVQRPTTTRSVVVHHPDVVPDELPLDVWQAECRAADLPLLEHVTLIDCPDPDTQSNDPRDDDPHGSRNLDRLRAILPHCDVLLCVGTAQKYKSAAVQNILREYSVGRAVLFIQTHAALDHDIRDDWRSSLVAAGFSNPQILRLDSRRVLEAVAAGVPLPEEYLELKRLLEVELHRRGHARLRRANAIGLLSDFADTARERTTELAARFGDLRRVIDGEAARLCEPARAALLARVERDRAAWRTRLMGETAARWGAGPLGVWLRLTTGWWSWAKWLPLLRARGTTALVLTGAAAVQSVGEALRPDPTAASVLTAESLGWTTGELSQARATVAGAARAAGIEPPNFDAMLAVVLQRAGNQLAGDWDTAIERRVARCTRPWRQTLFELPLALPAIWLIARWGYSFFYGHLWLGQIPTTWDIILQGLAWLLLIAWVLRLLLGRSLLTGWQYDAARGIQQITGPELTRPLFAEQLSAVERFETVLAEFTQLDTELAQERSTIETTNLSRLIS